MNNPNRKDTHEKFRYKHLNLFITSGGFDIKCENKDYKVEVLNSKNEKILTEYEQ